MKAIYIKPVTERVNLHIVEDIAKEWGKLATSQDERVVQGNDSFFDEEEYDDEYDPFFDE